MTGPNLKEPEEELFHCVQRVAEVGINHTAPQPGCIGNIFKKKDKVIIFDWDATKLWPTRVVQQDRVAMAAKSLIENNI